MRHFNRLEYNKWVQYKDLYRLAEKRTVLAAKRTYLSACRAKVLLNLANERTFSAWLRTGLALVVSGIAVSRFFFQEAFPWLARITGVFLILMGGAVYVIALLSYRKVLNWIDIGHPEAGPMPLNSVPIYILIIALLLSVVLSLLLILMF